MRPGGINHDWKRSAALAATLLLACPAPASTISNTATISWDTAAGPQTRSSNRVDIVRADPAPPPAAGLQATPLAQVAAATRALLDGTLCNGSAGTVPFRLTGAFADPPAVQRPQSASPGMRAGEPLVLSLTSAADNRDPLVVDTLAVTLTTAGGERETIVLTETGPDSALFVGAIRTAAVPPAPLAGDCSLSLRPGERVALAAARGDGSALGTPVLDILIDPYGLVFDSATGRPVDGARVTLVDAATGLPAQVFGDDALSAFPSTLISGGTVTDAGGTRYAFPPGEYRFPFARPGNYRLLIEPPAPYRAPSVVQPIDLAALRRPDGLPLALLPASYGDTVSLADPAPVRVDIPLDPPTAAILITKTASVAVAAPGDVIRYTVTITNPDATRPTGRITLRDKLPSQLRLRAGTVRVDQSPGSPAVTEGLLTLLLDPLPPRQRREVTYILEVPHAARAGTALNRAEVSDSGSSAPVVADAAVRITGDALSQRLTLIGRVTSGGCQTNPSGQRGIAGVRLMLEDGSYAVTDQDGRYHFDGLLPIRHVVALDPATLGAHRPVLCGDTARAAGSATSRLIDGQGGTVQRVDFVTVATTESVSVAPTLPTIATDPVAAGAERDWLSGQAPTIDWLFPEIGYNPRNPVTRVAIKHAPGQSVRLFVGAEAAPPVSFDGVKKSADGLVAVSLWRALSLKLGTTKLSAEIVDASGDVVQRLTRDVHFARSPLRAIVVPDQSRLVADGVTRPIIAVRLLDRDNKPVNHGQVGEFNVPDPYRAAVEVDAQQSRQLAGLERAKPFWRVHGDDGIAYIALEPTTASGALTLTLPFRDGEVTRTQQLNLWLSPGAQPWTLVGLAEGSVSYDRVRRKLEPTSDELLTQGRVALYAKGRVRGKWLLTLAYDTAKREADGRFAGTIDPQAYYTVYADASERRFDAASLRKLYLRLERPQFLALFGDFETSMAETQLARYQRALNGVKAQYASDRVRATAFAADTPFRFKRVELQANGLSGPYGLGARDIVPNSERVTLEIRDRLRSNLIVERRQLTRYADYDIDYASGLVRLSAPVLSRSSALDPQFIIVEFELNSIGQRRVNAGGRASWSNRAGTLVVGGSAIHDANDGAATDLVAIDLRYAPNSATEVRAEAAISRNDTTNSAWLIEAEHHGEALDLLAYARQQDAGYGVGQLNQVESGARKIGADVRLRVRPDLNLIASAWHEDQLTTDASRTAGTARIEYRGNGFDARFGLIFADDRRPDGQEARSAIVQLGATKRFFDGRLELDGSAELPVAKADDSVDFPARQRLAARFAVTSEVALLGSYEIAKGRAVDARTAQLGFELKPWAGSRFVASANQQAIEEYGARSFAAFGLAQSLPLGKRWTIDATLDGNRTLRGIDRRAVLNPLQPVASGGFLGSEGQLTEDFVAITGGATYRSQRWSVTGRVERRDGELGDRFGVTAGLLRAFGEGRAIGGLAYYTRATASSGVATRTAAVALSWANRPDTSRIAWLDKLELRHDEVIGAELGERDPFGNPLLVSGNVRSQRVVNSFSLNWQPTTRRGDQFLQLSEFALFVGTRYASERFGRDDVRGWSNLFAMDARIAVAPRVDLGVSGSLRESGGGRAFDYSYGPQISISPAKNSIITAGYNLAGFSDRDYADSRPTRRGAYLSFRLKFDAETLDGLGLNRR